MNPALHELTRVLTEKQTLMARLQTLLEEEQRCIVDLDLAGLERVGEEKTLVLEALQAAGDDCRQGLEQAARELRAPQLSSVSALIERIASPAREVLQGLQGKILAAAGTIDRLQSLNRELLEGGLGTVNNSLAFFRKSLSTGTTYGQAGYMVDDSTAGCLVRKEI